MKLLPYDRTFSQKLWALVLPMALQQLMFALVSASDALLLNLVSQDEMAAVSLATQVTFVFTLFLMSLAIGLSTLGAQYWGKQDRHTVEKLFSYVLRVSTVVGAGFFLVTLILPRTIMDLFTDSQVLAQAGARYLRLVSPAYLFSAVSQTYLCAMKVTDRAQSSGLISVLCMGLDVVLNLVLILGLWGFPKLGIEGAALSTTLTRGLELAWTLAASARAGSIRPNLPGLLRTEPQLRRDFWQYTGPVLANEIVWGLGFTMYSVIMGHMGSEAVAANAITAIAKNLVICLSMGLGTGGGILLGHALGAGELDKAKLWGKWLTQLSIASGVLSGLALLLCRPLILTAADLTPTATEYLSQMLVVGSAYLVGNSVNNTVIAGIFCSGGDSRFGLYCDLVVMWGIVVPLGLLAAFWWKLPVLTVYVLVSLDETLKLPAVWKHYHKYKWVRNLTIQEEQTYDNEG